MKAPFKGSCKGLSICEAGGEHKSLTLPFVKLLIHSSPL